DGTPVTLSGIRNPVTMNIPAGGQLARQFSEIVGATGAFNGWVQATSISSGLTGFCLNGNTALTDLDGAGPGSAAPEVVLPIAIEDEVTKTEITIVNVNAEPMDATLTMFDMNGDAIRTKEITL